MTLDTEHRDAEHRVDREDRRDWQGGLEGLWDLLLAAWDGRAEVLRRRLDAIEKTADAATYPDVLAKVMPSALRLASPKDLGKAVRPVVEEAILDSVHRHASVMAAAISPLLLPAVKRAIVEYFQQIVQGLDQALEQSLSPQGLRWRLEAMRSGRAFSEVVLLHSLIYRVESIFLIHKSTGTLLAHAARQHHQHADEIAGMLTAIRDFVQDSFAPEAGVGLRTMEVGTVAVWIEDLPHAAVAAVIRGSAPHDYRTQLAAVGRSLCLGYGPALAEYRGDVGPFKRAIEILEEGLVESFKKAPRSLERDVTRRHCIQVGLAALMATTLALALYIPWHLHQEAAAKRQVVEHFIASLEAVPGVIIVSTRPTAAGLEVRALRDRLADVANRAPPPTVQVTWRDFVSGDPAILDRRVRQALDLPSTVDATVKDGTLVLTGAAPRSWIATARAAAPAIAGIGSVDLQSLRDLDLEGVDQAIATIEAMTLPTDGRGLPPTAAPPTWIAGFAKEVLSLDRHAAAVGLPYYLVLQTLTARADRTRAKERLALLAGVLAWQLQERGVTTYALVRTDAVGGEGGGTVDHLVHLKVERQGVAYRRR